MGDLSLEELSEWFFDGFDADTALPLGPLQKLPIPVDGALVAARATTPRDYANVWSATVVCNEPVDRTVEFYKEFLPLSGYDILATGVEVQKRRWFGLAVPHRRELLVVRIGLYLGCLSIERRRDGRSTIEALIGERTHPAVRPYANSNLVRENPAVQWD